MEEGEFRDGLRRIRELDVAFDREAACLRVTMAPADGPFMTAGVIRGFVELARLVAARHGRDAPSSRQDLRFLVLRSARRDVFSLGGDLAFFADAIDREDVEALRAYGREGAKACHALASGMGACLVTVAVVEGHAVGAGLEAARCCDFVLAGEGATFRFPEANFGLFPSNGASTVLVPRLGYGVVRELVLGAGNVTSARALEIGLADSVFRGDANAAVSAELRRLAPVHAAAVALSRGFARTHGIGLPSFAAEAETWAATAVEIPRDDLRMMRRLAAIQRRPAADAAKREVA